MVNTLDKALARQGETLKALETWKAEMPTEAEMLPRDKYTMFDRKEKRYRKGIHSMSRVLFPLLEHPRRGAAVKGAHCAEALDMAQDSAIAR